MSWFALFVHASGFCGNVSNLICSFHKCSCICLQVLLVLLHATIIHTHTGQPILPTVPGIVAVITVMKPAWMVHCKLTCTLYILYTQRNYYMYDMIKILVAICPFTCILTI